jgi:N-methylhydantoinase A
MQAARGVLTLANLTMTEAIKQISIARGLDPRDFTLFCYGGGGPLHGAELARELHIPQVVIPPEPGNFSALGMLLADARLDSTRTFLAEFDEASIDRLKLMFSEIEASSGAALAAEFGVSALAFERKVELRYKGQKHSLRIDALFELPALRQSFDEAYRRRYGHARPQAQVEFVAAQSTARLAIERPDIERLAALQRSPRPVVARWRAMYFPDSESLIPTAVYDRALLPMGFAANGPAVIEEYGSTTIVGPPDEFTIGRFGEICIDCSR